MNWIKKIIRPLVLFVLPLVVIACTVSYKFNGSSINYDKVKTISIADFPIKSEYVYAPLATKFNEDLKDIFIRQTRLQLLSRVRMLTCRLTEKSQGIISITRQYLPTVTLRKQS